MSQPKEVDAAAEVIGARAEEIFNEHSNVVSIEFIDWKTNRILFVKRKRYDEK